MGPSFLTGFFLLLGWASTDCSSLVSCEYLVGAIAHSWSYSNCLSSYFLWLHVPTSHLGIFSLLYPPHFPSCLASSLTRWHWAPFCSSNLDIYQSFCQCHFFLIWWSSWFQLLLSFFLWDFGLPKAGHHRGTDIKCRITARMAKYVRTKLWQNPKEMNRNTSMLRYFNIMLSLWDRATWLK